MTSAAPFKVRSILPIFVAWIALAALLLPNSIGVESRLSGRARIAGSEQERTEALIEQQFDTTLVDPLILVVEGLDPVDTNAQAPVLAGLDQIIRQAAPQARVFSYSETLDPLFLSDDRTRAIVLVGIPRNDRQRITARLNQAAASYIAAQNSSLRLSWTSTSLINDDLRAMSAREASAAEIRILPIALLLLLIAFGSLTAGVVPVVAGILTVTFARGALSLIDTVAPLSFLSANVATMLGLGLSIDYSLLMVSRFREELARADARMAAATAMRSAGTAILLAGGGVACALAALLITPMSEVRSIAIAGLVAVVIAVSVSVTLLPAVLAFLGSRIDIFSVFRNRMAAASDSFWRWWGRLVFTRPIWLLAIGAAPLLVLATYCAQLDINLPRGDWLPASAHATQGADALARAGRAGLLQTVLVVAEFGAQDTASSERGQRALASLSARIAVDPRVFAVRSVQTIGGGVAIDELPEDVRRVFLSQDRRFALIAVTPRANLELYELSQLVRGLRKTALIDGIATIHVGGAPAYNADYADSVTRWFAPVAAIVLGATFLILAFGLRSVVLPLKAVALNLLSVGAALGAMTLVFQAGFGAQMLGLPGGYGGVFPVIPILVFAIVFGLSMDYEVFLFHRVVELHHAGASNTDAMTSGLRATAGVITSAAVLMVVVFGAFILGDFLFMKMLGFSLATAILIDSVMVRLVLGPALFAVAGRWNWWPFA